MVEALAHNWGWVVLRGVVAILFGALTLFNPMITLTALVLLFGAFALVDGALAVISAVTNRQGERRWVALLLGGFLGIAAGLLTFFLPGVTAVALLFVIAAWAILTGVATIVAAIRLRKAIAHEWILVLAGSVAIALGLILFAAPGAGALAMVLWIGAYAMVSGILLIALGLRLRRWGHLHPAGAMAHPA